MLDKNLHHFLEKSRCVAFLLYFRQHQGKMVRTHSRQEVDVLDVKGQPLGHLFQERVARRLPEAVVDIPEPLEIDQEQGQLVAAADRAAHVLRHSLEQ